ncbi:hypothetical protein E5676_scaffold157G00040 [Cucumis melo var. makuwa]|uniref:Reverse transcriptase Ty1/copia-type domain-containing protein n=1 Tax=Cucumis melo var. makuwa TaxID=1194695 RepID=A0A5D3C2T9_CUCMM|nr:hypothetical protein E6C27_scaffold455G00040 [Cucumis melo var. makuwa]TYK06233.1 hypothetical protein E5676_scaffold157G00040 [Cucumis melo var. makuwa]
MEDKKQVADDSTVDEGSETAIVHMKKESVDDSFEVEPMHEIQEPVEQQEEIEALHQNKTWELVTLPQGRKPIGNKWVYKIKRNNDDQVEQYRARLVVKGYAQKLDVKTTFLHGDLEEEIYMLQGKENLVCRLNKSLYDPCAYLKRSGEKDFIVLLLYVDDMLVAGPNKDRIEELKAHLAREFEMKDLGPTNKILGMILRYIKGSIDVALCYGGTYFTIKGYVDSDYTGDLDKNKSTTGYVFTLASGAVSWFSKLQSVVAMSTTEGEYVAATQASKEAVWLKMLLEELGHERKNISLFCDNQSGLYLARNLAFHAKTKHIRVQYYFVREKVEEGIIDMHKIHTKENLADYLTKTFNTDKFI